MMLSETLPLHLWKSVTRVYGGFFAAALVGIPLGLLIGRIKVIRDLLDPTLQLLRPVPVTAWLPLSMIFSASDPMRRSSWCSLVRSIRLCSTPRLV